uniref:Uncharacterized protein n=1 Tax=Rhizophora mucronata TaxID=61149 RepID=A0A2P2JME7_RHIMU
MRCEGENKENGVFQTLTALLILRGLLGKFEQQQHTHAHK